VVNCECAVLQPYPHRPEWPDPLELQGGMPRVISEGRIARPRLCLHWFRQSSEGVPETGAGTIRHLLLRLWIE